MPADYDKRKTPHAPALPVRLGNPGESPRTEVYSALVDTGSDYTLVALQRLLSIDAPAVRGAYARGFWSDLQPVVMYLVDLHLETGTLPGIEVIGWAGDSDERGGSDEIVLGRNVLNNLLLLLDGPREVTEVLQRRMSRRPSSLSDKE